MIGTLILCIVFGLAAAVCHLVLQKRFIAPALPLHIGVGSGVDNLEWLLLYILVTVPDRQLILIDQSQGQNSRAIKIAARRYELECIGSKPAGLTPEIKLFAGITTAEIRRQYLGEKASA